MNFFIFIIISFLLESYSLYILFTDISCEYFLVFHILASLFASLSVYSTDNEKRVIYPFVFISIFSMSLFGYLAISRILTKRNIVYKNLYTEYREHILISSPYMNGRSPKLRKSFDYLKFNMDPEPFRDLVKSDQEYNEKLNLIRSLGKLVSLNSIKILKELLNDPHMDIRYYAGEEIASIGEKYNLFINELRKAIKEHPDDYKSYLDLGSVIMEYAFCGLFDDCKTINKELEQAKTVLYRALELNSEHYEPNFLLGKIYLYQRDYIKAIELFKKSVYLKDNDISSLINLTECHWYMKNLSEIDKSVEMLKGKIENYEGEDKDLLREFVENWRYIQ